jgi:hypothetical protein
MDLDFEVNRASKDKPEAPVDTGPTLLKAEDTTGEKADKDGDLDVSAVFAKLKQLKGSDEE